MDFIRLTTANFENAITSNTQVWKKSHVTPIYTNQDLLVFPERDIHPLSGDFKNCDFEWLLAEIKGDYDLVFSNSAWKQRFPRFYVCVGGWICTYNFDKDFASSNLTYWEMIAITSNSTHVLAYYSNQTQGFKYHQRTA